MVKSFLLPLTVGAMLAGSALAAAPPRGLKLLEESYSFDQWQQHFRKGWTKGSAEWQKRKAIFEKNLAAIRAHNKAHKGGESSYVQGLNKFSHLTAEEFGRHYRGYNKEMRASHDRSASHIEHSATERRQLKAIKDLPKSLDWREKGVLTPVKDQGGCGSCWAFGSTETVESHVAIATGHLMELSVQQLVSCMPNPMKCGGQGGCKGAIPELAFNYLQIAGGQTTEYRMPYTSYKGDNGNCSFNNTARGTPAAVSIGGYIRVKSNDAEAVMNALQLGPLAVSVDAGGWQHYESGVYDAPFKSNSTTIDIDHVVQLVGYGKTNKKKKPYWIIRNSWATGWGEKGFMRIMRSPNPSKPICKDDTTVLDGTACEFQKDIVQHACGPAGILFDVAYPLGAALA